MVQLLVPVGTTRVPRCSREELPVILLAVWEGSSVIGVRFHLEVMLHGEKNQMVVASHD